MEEITKVCNKCGVRKALDKFQKQERGLYGRRSDCRECRNTYTRERRRNIPEEGKKHREKNLAYYHKNKDKILPKIREYTKRPEVHPKILKKHKEYWHNKVDKATYNAKRNERNKWRYKHDPAYKQRAKKESRHSAKMRKYRLRNIEGSYSEREWEALCKKYDYKCLCCGEKKPLQRDHAIPVSKPGATNYITNIVPLCVECNQKKGNKLIDHRPPEDRPRGQPPLWKQTKMELG